MNVNMYLNFQGDAAEAMDFYAKTFKGTLLMTMTWGESPMCDDVEKDWQDKLMHTAIKIGDSVLMGADTPPNRYQPGGCITASVAVDTPEEAEHVFAELAEGGSIQMAITETFWAKRFGMATDRFGIPWMVNCEKKQEIASSK